MFDLLFPILIPIIELLVNFFKVSNICKQQLCINQILINLISNSIKAVASGGRVTIVACSDGDRVCLVISDNGYGIPEDDLPHIFERFFKGKNGGLGLGLAIVQELVSAHGGTVSVRSTTGSGTSFCVKLP